MVSALLFGLCPELGKTDMPFKNLDFAEVSDDRISFPRNWVNMGDDCEESVVIDAQDGKNINRLRITIENPRDQKNAVCGITQRVDTENVRGKELHISVKLRSLDTMPDEAGLWIRVDSQPGRFLAFRRSLLSSSTEMNRGEELTAVVPVYAASNSIGFGIYLKGEGEIVISNLAMSLRTPEALIPPIVLEYLSEVHTILKENSINRNEIDWSAFWQDTLMDASRVETIAELHQVMPQILWRLGDRHSFFVPAERRQSNEPISQTSLERGIDGHLVDQKIGYLWMPGVSGEESISQEYAETLRHTVESLSQQGAIAWLIDLRGNGGGNMWPMLAGIAPIIGQGTVGQFIDPDGESMQWSLEGFSSRLEGEVRTSMQHPGRGIEAMSTQPVAVLAGGTTASSGEAVVVAFRCRSRVQQFGAPTRGLSTANNGSELSDGSLIALTVSTFADTCGNEYGGPLEPDVLAEPSEAEDPSFTDPAAEEAIAWLLEELGNDARRVRNEREEFH